MHKAIPFLFLALLTASGRADSPPVLHTLYDIFHSPDSAASVKQGFDIEGDVNFFLKADNSISFQDDCADSTITCPQDLSAESLVGCHVRVTGQLVSTDLDVNCAQATNVQIISRGPRPKATHTNAASLLGGTHVGKIVALDGLVSDICKDDVDPDWTLLTVISGNEAVGCCLLGDLTSHLQEYLGAEVTVTGQCARHIRGHRHFMGPVIYLSDRQSIKIRQAPPEDPFASPPLYDVLNVTPHSIVSLGRRCASGRVLAAWGRHQLLIRTEANDLCRVSLTAPADLPPCGEVIDVSGFPNTDLYHLNLYRACWRVSAKALAITEQPPVDVTAEEMLVNTGGLKRIRYRFHGRQIRLQGKVITLPSAGNDDGILSLEDGQFTVPVNISACPGALHDVPLGSTITVTGICIINTLNPSAAELVPGINGFTTVVRNADDIQVLSRPSWWTPKRLLLLIGFLAAILSGILVWNLMLHRAAERQGRQLAKESIARAAANLRVGERTRLAVELHDTLVQNMTGVAIALRTHNYDLAAKTLDFCRKDLRNCLWDLRNLTLDDEDINAAIRKTLAPHAAGVRLQVRFSVPREKFTDNTTHAILCILRELTINAVRHGNATAIWVAGSTEGDKLLFSLKDNGCGFDPAAAPGMEQGHFGLQGIRDRVEGFEGNMTVESAPGKGTKVTIVLSMSHLDNTHPT